MRFSFLHAADLHLGSPLAGLAVKEPRVAERIALAGREALSNLVTAAVEEGVRFVVIAGDVYDREWRDASIGLFFAREMARLARAGIPAFVIRGNHDAESVVTKSITLPDTVRVFSTRKAETLRLDEIRVALHGRSFADRVAAENFVPHYPDAVPGWFNLGVLHTSLDGRPGHDPYAPCSLADLAARGYDYWALGHIHAREIVARDPWVVYPGNIQGRSVRECGPKGAMLVEVEDGRVVDCRHLATAPARFETLAVALDAVADEAQALAAIEAALVPHADGAGLLALRVTLTGATPLDRRFAADPARLRVEVQAALDRVREDVWLEKLVVGTTSPAAAAGGATESLDVAALLAGLESDPALRDRMLGEIAAVSAKLPAAETDETPLADEIDAILAEARALVTGRALGGDAR